MTLKCRSGSISTVPFPRDLTWVSQARRFSPLMVMAQDPQIPWRQERRKVRLPSWVHLIWFKESRMVIPSRTSSWYVL